MRKKIYKRCSLLMAMFMLVSGVLFDTVNNDISFINSFTNVSEAASGSSIMFCDAVIQDAEVCTAEMLGINYTSGTQQMVSRYINQRNDGKFSFDIEHSDRFVLSEVKTLTDAEPVQDFCQYPEELVTSYIHKTDGKKRI